MRCSRRPTRRSTKDGAAAEVGPCFSKTKLDSFFFHLSVILPAARGRAGGPHWVGGGRGGAAVGTGRRRRPVERGAGRGRDGGGEEARRQAYLKRLRMPRSSRTSCGRSQRACPYGVQHRGVHRGAGRGGFHSYRQQKRRNQIREAAMEADLKREKEQTAFDARKAELAKVEENKTAKRRAKRQKLKAKKRAKKGPEAPVADLGRARGTRGWARPAWQAGSRFQARSPGGPP